jgi:hypothetical protein
MVGVDKISSSETIPKASMTSCVGNCFSLVENGHFAICP